VLALAALVPAPLLVAVPASHPATSTTLQVGTATLRPCANQPAWCGSLPEPFDRTDPLAGTINIGFMWFPASSPGTAAGTIVAEEGGPGFPSTGTRGQYLQLYRPLLNDRNLLLVDNRGTGTSGAINCPSLERFAGVEPSVVFAAAVRACGDRLDHERRRPDGTWVHGADLYGTANAARDLADVLTALQTGPVDLYGDSYGTWFSQTFASRYPQMLRSITLDASYQVLKLDPWYVSTVTTARGAFDATCRRSPACADAAPGASWPRISELATRLRQHPLFGTTVDNSGVPTAATVDIRTLVNLVNDAGVDAGVYAQLDAAARAILDAGDGVPLLRLAVQSLQFDNGGSGGVKQFSDGLYFAVACTDYPQLFDMRAAPAERRLQMERSIDRLPDRTFAPFSTREWIQVDAYNEAYNACLDWPAPTHTDPPITVAPPLVPPTVPVLVLGGDLDSLTPILDGGRLVARQMGPSARLVVVPNTVHVTALGDQFHCASSLARTFLLDPAALPTLDTSCTKRVPEVRMVGRFPRTVGEALAAEPLRGNQTGVQGLRAAAVAAATAGDVVFRSGYVTGPNGAGLRGGSYTSRPSPGVNVFQLQDVRWVDDATVSGVVAWGQRDGQVTAELQLRSTHGGDGTMTIAWNALAPRAVATVTGRFDGQNLSAELPAP
jgi:pimeloyl-ACP methyl ester carboxylesterase